MIASCIRYCGAVLALSSLRCSCPVARIERQEPPGSACTVRPGDALRARTAGPRTTRTTIRPANVVARAAARHEPVRQAGPHQDGIVKEFTRNQDGDTDGLRLDDGTEVRFPARRGQEADRRLSPLKDRVTIDGMDPCRENPRSTPQRSSMKPRAKSSSWIGRRPRFRKVPTGLAADGPEDEADDRPPPSPRGRRSWPARPSRSEATVAHPDGTRGGNTPWNRPCRTRRSSTRSPSTAWPS